MKIECDKCSAKYSIADEKVRGKTFKIRCKKCSNVIIVRDKGAATEASAPSSDDEQVAPGWHLAINGETVGPMADDEVRQRYSAGEIDKETAIWQEGFDDWMPLSDVPEFADLPQSSGSSDDAVAATSANQDDYAASVAATGTDGLASSESSPRVSKLTGQRNENSVLFSLDSLQAMASSSAATAPASMSAPAARVSANPSKGLATSAPSSEGSGLIDIRALGAMVGGSGASAAIASSAPQGAADDAGLPSFGGGGFGGLAATPLVARPVSDTGAMASAAAPVVVQPRSNAVLYIMMFILILAVGGLAAFILLGKDEPTIVEKEVPVIIPQIGAAGDDEDDEDDEDKDKKDDQVEGDEEDSEGESEESGDPEAGNGSSRSSRRGRKRSSGSSKSASPSPTPSSSSPSSGSSKKSSDDSKDTGVSVDCILDPSKCSGSKKPSKKPSSGGGGGGGATDPNAPEKLSSSDLKAGVSLIKSAAKACGSKHGAKSGEKVAIKFSLTGSSGTVSKATPLSPHGGTALGNCVASAAKKAKFKKFKASAMGFQYNFPM